MISCFMELLFLAGRQGLWGIHRSLKSYKGGKPITSIKDDFL